MRSSVALAAITAASGVYSRAIQRGANASARPAALMKHAPSNSAVQPDDRNALRRFAARPPVPPAPRRRN